MSLVIRAARPGDEGLILNFIRALAEYERLLDLVRVTEQHLTQTLFAPNARVFCDIAEWNGKPAGFAVWFYNYSTFQAQSGIFLEDLFVEPQLRGKGIGKTMLVHLAKRAVREGCSRVQWSVLNWNEPSIKFYRSLGAEPVEEWSDFRLMGDALTRLADER
jgi:GNAT superfamily N-acetyltransferase